MDHQVAQPRWDPAVDVERIMGKSRWMRRRDHGSPAYTHPNSNFETRLIGVVS